MCDILYVSSNILLYLAFCGEDAKAVNQYDPSSNLLQIDENITQYKTTL